MTGSQPCFAIVGAAWRSGGGGDASPRRFRRPGLRAAGVAGALAGALMLETKNRRLEEIAG
jgi:hypothetical protein